MSEELFGIKSAPTPKHPDEGAKFPKWVKPHESHLVVDGLGHLSVPGFAEFHLDRVNKEVTVLAEDAEAEKRAHAPKKKGKGED